ncbi:SGNH/GDSL hydrolase family protein [Baaleninema sp.]|uniref:SGNH/GDSL hydrolase family protein n=1 Tax=Baaleninema sp. TaxID=3101197 RepID=UPI003CFCFD02
MTDKKPAPKNKGSFLPNLILAGVSALFTLIFLELGARAYLFHFATDDDFTTFASLKQLEKASRQGKVGGDPQISHHRYLGYTLTPNYEDDENRHNSLGYRGEEIIQPKPEGEFRIVCIGGSTTYTTRVDDYRLSYPDLLEKELQERGYTNVNVVNAGVPGWESWNFLIDFELRTLDLDPDMIIVYSGYNDFKPRVVEPESYKGDNSGRAAPMIERVYMPGWLEYSTLYRIVAILSGWMEPHTSYNTINSSPKSYLADEFHDQLEDGTYPTDEFEEMTVQEILQANPPIYYQRNIENIVAIAQSRNIKVMLATMALFSQRPDIDQRAGSPEYQFAIAEHNQVLKNIAQRRNVSLLDFAATFPRQEQYYDDGVHVTEAGSRLKAQMFANFIVEQSLVPKE